jgi:hypothetical protein
MHLEDGEELLSVKVPVVDVRTNLHASKAQVLQWKRQSEVLLSYESGLEPMAWVT